VGRKFGFSWSWKRAVGLSGLKGKISRKIGIPLTRQGRQRKVGRALGCCISFFIFSIAISLILASITYALIK